MRFRRRTATWQGAASRYQQSRRGPDADVNEAYATLRDPAKRKRYDIESKVRQFVPPVSAQAQSFQPGGAVDW